MNQFTSVFNNIKLPSALQYADGKAQASGSNVRPKSTIEITPDPLSFRQSGKVKQEDFEATMEKERTVITPNDSYETVIGYDQVVLDIAIGLADKIKDAENENVLLVEQNSKNTGINGYLLVGVPGVGKTMLLRAVGAGVSKCLKLNVSFFRVTPALINSCYHGDSEKLVEALFAVAAKHAPTILAFDEVDSLCAKRLDSEQTHIRSLKNTLLDCLQGIKPHPNVIICAGTNLPDQLDSAFRRRFEMQYVLRPPIPEQRLDIIYHAIESSAGTEGYDHEILTLPLNQKILRELTEGFTGSDLVLSVKKAVKAVTYFQHDGVNLQDNDFKNFISKIEKSEKAATTVRGLLTMDIFVKHGVNRVRPTYTMAEFKKVEKFAAKYCANFNDNMETQDLDSSDDVCVDWTCFCGINRF